MLARAAKPEGKRQARWAWLGAVLGLVLGLVCFAPAYWLAAALASASGGRVLLLEPRGTVWRGSANLVLSGGAGSQDQAALPTRLDWRIALKGLGLAAQLQTPCCTREPLRLRLGWGQGRGAGATSVSGWTLTLERAAVQWPAALLAGLGTPWNTLGLEGGLALDSTGLSVEWAKAQAQIKGQALLEVTQLSSRLATLKPLGNYRLTFDGASVNNLQLQTLDGALTLSGTGTWSGARLRFSGVAQAAAPEHEAALANVLGLLGQREGARALIAVDL